MGEAEAIRILLEFSDMLTPSNIFYFLVRFLGWGLIKLLEILVNSAQGVLDNIMKFLNFFDSAVVSEIIDKIKPIAIAFLAIALLYISYQLMMNRKKFDVSKIPSNIVIALLIVFFLPTAMKSLGDMTKEGFKLFTADDGTLATEIISSNVTDVYLFDQNNFESRDLEPKEEKYNMGEAEAIRILLEFSDMLTPSNIFYFLVRFLGWGLIKLLEILVNSAQGVLDNIMKFLNFFDSAVVNQVIDKIKPIAIAFLAIALLYISYQLMMNRKKFDISKIPSNIVIALLIVFFLPTAMKSLGDMTKEGFKLFTADDGTLATEIISSNVTDVYLFDQNNFESRDLEPRNNIDKSNITKIDPTEEIDRSKVSNKKVFENKLIPSTKGDGYELTRINGWFKIDSEYYRWDINFFQIITTLLITALVLIFTMVKVVKLMIELAFGKVFIMGVVFADIGSGQKTKQILMHILSLYIAIISVGLTLELYILGTAWMQNRVTGFASVMINFGAGLFVIDGPNLLEKIFGVDAGLSSGVRTLMGINSAMDILGKVGRGLDKVSDIAKDGLGAAATLGAGLKGFRDGAIPDLEDEMNNNGFNPLQQSLLGDGAMKELGDGNSDIDDDVFSSIDNNPPDDMPPNDGMENDVSDLYSNRDDEILNSDVDDNMSELHSNDIPNLDDSIASSSLGDDDISNTSLGSETKSLEDLDRDIPTLDNEIGNNKSGISNKDFGKEGKKINGINIDIPGLNEDRTDSRSGIYNRNISELNGGVGSTELGNNFIQGDNFTMDKVEPLSGKGNGVTSYNRLAKGENREWTYGETSTPNFNGNSNTNAEFGVGVDLSARRREYDKPNYIDPKETRNVKDLLGGLMNSKVNNIKNSELANNMRTSYKIGNNTAPNYIDPKETRNVKDLLGGLMNSKVNNIKNSELANNMRTSYKIGNNTAKDLRRYVGIKEQEIKDKIVADRIRRNL